MDQTKEENETKSIYATIDGKESSVPVDTANRHYAEILKQVAEETITIVDIPASLQTEADTWLFNKQLGEYNVAIDRLAQYVLSVGKAEVKEMKSTGEQVFNDATKVWDDVQEEVVVANAIDPLDATVEQTTYSDDGTATVSTVTNPLIATDVAERAAAQTVVDNTPQPVKDSV